MRKVKVVFFLPLRDNDGRELTDELDAAEIELYATFVGWSMIGTVKGMYRMADLTPAFDECNAYMVVTDEGRLDELRAIVLAFKAKTTQEAIFFEIQYDVNVEFL